MFIIYTETETMQSAYFRAIMTYKNNMTDFLLLHNCNILNYKTLI